MLSLLEIKNTIEEMDKYHHIEILKILNDEEDIVLNENNNGIFVNLTNMNKDIIQKLIKYIDYVNFQQENLEILEHKKDTIEQKFFYSTNPEGNIKFSDTV